MKYSSTAWAPDEADKMYVHELQEHTAYEPKLRPCVTNLWLKDFQVVFCLHDLNLYCKALKLIQTRAEGVAGEDLWTSVPYGRVQQRARHLWGQAQQLPSTKIQKSRQSTFTNTSCLASAPACVSHHARVALFTAWPFCTCPDLHPVCPPERHKLCHQR